MSRGPVTSGRRKIAETRFKHIGICSLLLCMALAGCSSMGPSTVSRDRIDYNAALANSWKEQLLQNIVRLRYSDTLQFMDVSSIVSGYSLQGQIQASATQTYATFPGYPGPQGTALIGATGMYQDRPTISYMPLAGKKFTQTLIEPIPPFTIFSLITAGYPVDLVIPATVRAMNGVYGRTIQAGVTRPATPEYTQLLAALSRIQAARALSVQVEKHGNKQSFVTRWSWHGKPEIRKDVEFVLKTLKLSPKNGEVILTYGAMPRQKDELAILSRSMLEILGNISAAIMVPEQDVKDGRTFANLDESVFGPEGSSRIKIQSGTTSPDKAYAAVRYGDTWFWISDQDLVSKRAFSFLSLFFALAETGTVPAAPQLTIPVQ